MFRFVEICALAFVAVLPAGVALRVAEPAPTAALAQASGSGATPGTARLAPQQVSLVHGAKPATVERAGDGMFYVEALVNGAPVRFLVDTGASVVVLTEADAAAAGLTDAASRPGTSLRTVSGTVDTRWTRLELELAGRKLAGIEAAVVGAGPGTSLLGQNALAGFGSITIEGDRLVLR